MANRFLFVILFICVLQQHAITQPDTKNKKPRSTQRLSNEEMQEDSGAINEMEVQLATMTKMFGTIDMASCCFSTVSFQPHF